MKLCLNMSRSRIIFPMLVAMIMSVSVQAETTDSAKYQAWQAELRTEALAKGIRAEIFDAAFGRVALSERVIELDRKQPEFTLTLDEYLTRVISNTRIKNAKKKIVEHADILDEVSKTYGVQKRYIVALWGIETNFGSHTGGFEVISALATLAYDGRRSAYFRKELLSALQILNEGIFLLKI